MGSIPREAEHFGSPQCSATGYVKALVCRYRYSRVYATGHIKDPVPLIEKRRGLFRI